MTALPRNFTRAPVCNNVRGNTEGVSQNLVAAEGVDQFFSHAPLSQIVTLDASEKTHSLCVADIFRLPHFVTMESHDKNGGPNHLRAWRVYRGLTQQQLASAVGTNSNMIGYLEGGERALSAKWLRRLAPALDTTPGLLLDHDPNMIDADILEMWTSAGTREKRQISEIAKTLLRDGTHG